jgi:hypothetical protein
MVIFHSYVKLPEGMDQYLQFLGDEHPEIAEATVKTWRALLALGFSNQFVQRRSVERSPVVRMGWAPWEPGNLHDE